MRKFIAHRGNNNHGYFENTCEALLASLNTSYIDGVELDIRRTKDNQLVMIHNATIASTSDGHGIVKYMTLDALQQYNFGTTSQSSKICTLDTFLQKVHSHKIIMIEVKESDTEELLYRTIQKYPNLNFYICSFDYDFLIQFKIKHPTYKVGLIMGDIINHNKDINPFDFISTKDIHRKGPKEIFFWGIDSIQACKKTNSNANIITDKSYLFTDCET